MTRTEVPEGAEAVVPLEVGRASGGTVTVDAVVRPRASVRRRPDAHATGVEPVLEASREVPIAEFCSIGGVDEGLVRAAMRRIAAASNAATLGERPPSKSEPAPRDRMWSLM